MRPKRSAGDGTADKAAVKKAKVHSDLATSLSSLYKRCVPEVSDQHPREDQLLDAEERGELSQTVWPFLVEKHAKGGDHRQDILWFHGCHLLALLVSLHCREGTFPASTPLAFMTQQQSEEDNNDKETRTRNRAVLEDAVQTLVYHDQKGFRFQTTVIHLVLIANTCSDHALTVCNPGLILWKVMPERRRELEFKRYPMLQKKFAAIAKNDNNDKKKPFLVLLLSKIVHLLEGETDGHGKRLLHFYDALEEAEKDNDAKQNSNNMEVDQQEDDNNNDGNEPSTSVRIEKAASSDVWTFLHRSLELMIDLLSNHETRQYLVVYMDSMHFTVRCRLAVGNRNARFEPLRLAQQLLQRINRLMTLLPLETSVVVNTQMSLKSLSPTPVDIVSLHHRRATTLQKMCHRHYPHLKDVIYAGVGLLCNNHHNQRNNKNKNKNNNSIGAEGNAKYVRRVLGGLKEGQLDELLHRLRLVDSKTTEDVTEERNDAFLWAVLLEYLTIPPHPLEQLKSFPLYPTETVLWDHNLIPPTHLAMRQTGPVLSLPKLNKRFLSYQDYLLRNFELVRLESAYEIRSDLVDVIRRLRPVVRQSMDIDQGEDIVLKTEFRGWARMALELDDVVQIKRVDPPTLGNVLPAQVVAEFAIDLQPCGDSIRREWDQLAEFDNLFLVTVDASKMTGAAAPAMRDFYREQHQKPFSERDLDRRVPDEEDGTFPQRFGVAAVRGCMVLQVRDEQGNVLSDPSSKESPSGTKRIFRVALDPAQYVMDRKVGTELYAMMNLVVRRKGSENNFKSVLETIRGLMDGVASISRVMPSWLQMILLGLGDPTSASYKSSTVRSYARKTVGVAKPDAALDFGDTFLDEKHLREALATSSMKITVDDRDKLPGDAEASGGRKNYRIRFVEGANEIEATSYPFPSDCSGNPVRFTRPQVEAIRAGLSPGLSLVVGPPGTGKTDVAVQIIASLYHSFPAQRTVIITHSNAALNDIFQKVMSRGDINERYMVRLGSGERDLETSSTHDFSKPGRVAYSLHQRSKLLEQVQLLSESLGVSSQQDRGKDGSAAYTCETAEYFFFDHVQKRIQMFEKNLALTGEKEAPDLEVTGIFPFGAYNQVGENEKVTLSRARESFEKLNQMFAELAEYRPLELLHSQRRRVDYLIMKQARIVAMTCTHAAIARSHLIEIGFEYDNVVMEEAGQMSDIETFIPLLLQRGESDESSRSSAGVSRLKRVCLMGDHKQLPPVVKNTAFSKFSNLDQSLFSRLIRLDVPYVQLDKQGRARAEIASLYSWRYKNLGDLDHVQQSKEFQLVNSGFAHTFQIINVEDFEGKGESSPTAYFYQNVGEAEYAVALFQYMVLIGHSPEKITILTTYNGQKALIQDILAQRCGEGTPLAGIRPGAVSTVDKYQGQQNDFILLSLVRTHHVGHIRDIRRLVVAVSRSRLGLYVFCRQSLFAKCHELKRTLDQFTARPSKLQLVLGESHPTERTLNDKIPKDKLFEVEDVSHLGSMVHTMQEELINSQMEEAEVPTGQEGAADATTGE
ncbi:Intron-binding protein aquarius [Seminavis robusta]|uniref:Intron-binding protein aquarius n=1 Tax=Seminavis robusta TaxID=568900 RepID=A0A9N8HBW7_9STRA|nr:Intron-binding protein aquarius [Seminavis robusta]|eukprot:Sro382_g130980.1 Intron-binding protein aquarius (1530) ;mRNA; f:12272-17044